MSRSFLDRILGETTREGDGPTAVAIASLIVELGYSIVEKPKRCRHSSNQMSWGAWSWGATVRTSSGSEITIGSQMTMKRVLREHRRGNLEVNNEDGAIHLDAIEVLP